MDVVLWSEDWDVAEVLIFLCLGAKIGLADWDRLGLDADPIERPLGWRSMPGGLGIIGPLSHLLKENMFIAT